MLHGNAKTDEELELAVEPGVGLVVVDNFDDIDRLERIVPAGRRQPCLVRVIPGVEADHPRLAGDRPRRLEVRALPGRRPAAIARIERSARLRLDGVHTHVGSQLLDVDQLAAAVEPIAALGTFDVYDLGGGLGVRYTYGEHPPTLDDYADAMIGRRARCCPPAAASSSNPAAAWSPRPRLHACTASRRSNAACVTHVAVDGGMGDNLEVSLTGQRFEAAIVDRFGGGDVVTRRRQALRVRRPAGRRGRAARCPVVGDLLAVPVTGAYCYTMSNQYNGARRVPVVFARDGEARLVVRRDTWDDLLARDVDELRRARLRP